MQHAPKVNMYKYIDIKVHNNMNFQLTVFRKTDETWIRKY